VGGHKTTQLQGRQNEGKRYERIYLLFIYSRSKFSTTNFQFGPFPTNWADSCHQQSEKVNKKPTKLLRHVLLDSTQIGNKTLFPVQILDWFFLINNNTCLQ